MAQMAQLARTGRHLRIALALVLGALLAGPAFADCVPDEETLCLLAGRIQVRAEWRNQHAGGVSGIGRSTHLTAQTGAFWFFDDQNLEVMIKALDGRPINGQIWIFLGSLSDVEYWVYVDDTATGLRRVFHNPPGNLYGIAETMAFDGAGPACVPFIGIDCDPGSFCEFASGNCGFLDGGGTCVEVPGGQCSPVVEAVCGCDDVSYQNDCFRRQAKVSKLHDGACEPKACGGFAGTPCPGEEFCDVIPGACGGADLPGTCIERPTPEVCDLILAPSMPVCGCDGMTYDRDCYRLAAGVQKDHDGPC